MALASAAESGSPPRAWPLVVIGGWSALLFLAGLTVVGAFGSYAGSFYWFTIPFLAASGLCAAAAAAGACWRGGRARVFRIVAPLHALLILPSALAMALWPGGDDGPGMAWQLFIFGGSAVALVLAVVLMAVKRRAG